MSRHSNKSRCISISSNTSASAVTAGTQPHRHTYRHSTLQAIASAATAVVASAACTPIGAHLEDHLVVSSAVGFLPDCCVAGLLAASCMKGLCLPSGVVAAITPIISSTHTTNHQLNSHQPSAQLSPALSSTLTNPQCSCSLLIRLQLKCTALSKLCCGGEI